MVGKMKSFPQRFRYNLCSSMPKLTIKMRGEIPATGKSKPLELFK